MSKFYSGIGSRKTPQDILDKMTYLAYRLQQAGYVLRSGGAAGADTAFAAGTNDKEIYRPNGATVESIQLASKIHPAWDKCKPYVRKLHARNMQIVLGKDLDSPSEFIICWTPGGKSVGGTSQAIRLAEKEGIPVFNLGRPGDEEKLEQWIVQQN